MFCPNFRNLQSASKEWFLQDAVLAGATETPLAAEPDEPCKKLNQIPYDFLEYIYR